MFGPVFKMTHPVCKVVHFQCRESIIQIHFQSCTSWCYFTDMFSIGCTGSCIQCIVTTCTFCCSLNKKEKFKTLNNLKRTHFEKQGFFVWLKFNCEYCIQMRIQNPVKYQRWSVLRRLLNSLIRQLFLLNNPS